MSNLGGEKDSVQKPIINYVSEPSGEYLTSDGKKIFVKLGWEYIKPDEALRLRDSEADFLFKDIFITQIKRLNPFIDIALAEDIIKSLKRIPSNINGNFIAWEYLKGLRTIFVPNEKRERNVKFFDAEDIGKNIFQITDEFTFRSGTKKIRFDIVFLINGLPVLFIETKAANKIEGISEAFEQVKRYHRECPEILAILQIYALINLSKFYYSATWNESKKLLFNWKEEIEGNFETLVKTFFDKERIIKVLLDFILFTRQDNEIKKVVLRPHQMRAVERVIERAMDSEKKRALIWHTQGSGKTYTMIVAAQKIIENPLFEKPTVLMLVDRNELESQLFGNLHSLGIESVEVAKSKKHLLDLLKSDRRGLIITMIHKFDGIPENINTRKNIFVLIDEAHRTTGGTLGNYLTGALPNATYIGFTGTPIDKTNYGKGTFIVFGKDDPPKGYLDKYSIVESIADGTTVPLHYTLAPNELKVDREILEKEFLNLADAQGINDVETLNKVLNKAVTLKNMLKNKERVEKVAKYIAEHFREYIEPMGYKAFLVAVDREACALYKDELDKYLPPEYSKVVYSPSANDPPQMAKYHLSDNEEMRVRRAFRKPDGLPKILIVTEKLLTGFDAPILYCMYLDKPMRDHVLLQAIARVNRPYEDEERKKISGLVLDFIGIFDNLEKALAFDSEDIEGVVHDIMVLKERFNQEMKVAKENYLKLVEGKTQDKAVEAVLEYFRDEKRRHEYYKFFKELSDIYEILSPDAFLRPYIKDYMILARIYSILKECYEKGVTIGKEFTRKTAKLVQEYTKSGEIKPTIDIYEINEDTLRKLEESKASDIEKVFNLLKSIEKAAERWAEESPYLISIAEKAERIVKLYENRQKSTQETLEELKKMIEEANSGREEQAIKDMPGDIFTIYWVLKKDGFETAETMANQMQDVLRKYPHWRKSEKQEREIRTKLYEVLIKSGPTDTDKASETVQKIIRPLKGDVGK